MLQKLLAALRPIEVVDHANPLVKVFRSLKSQKTTLTTGGVLTLGGLALLALIGINLKGGGTVVAAMCGKLQKTKFADQAVDHLLTTGECIPVRFNRG